MPKTPNKKAAENASPPFEEALAELEELVREMESDQMPLEELIRNYEKGSELFRHCEKSLDEAEDRISIIRKSRNGENVVEVFDDDEEAAPEAAASPSETDEGDDNGELF
jgi:exodeoxyribonuclease VII small subunit